MRHDPRAFGRRPAYRPEPPANRLPVALLIFGMVLVLLSIGMTFVPDVKPAGPFLIMLSGFVLFFTAIITFRA